MFVTNLKRFTLTLVICIVLVLVLATTADAAIDVNRRDHGSIKRLIKKRSPFPQGPVIGAAPAPPPLTTPSSTSSATVVTSVSSDTSQTSSETPLLTGTSLSSPLSGASSSSGSSTSTSSESSAVTTSSSAPSTTSAAPQTSDTLNLSAAVEDTATNSGKPTVTRTSSVTASSASASAEAVKAAAKTKSTTLTALIIVASCIGGVAILWTVFRKWKLGRSAKFDARLQPIDWQPTNPEEGIIPHHRRVNSDTSSFHSGTGHGTSDLGHGNSDHGHGASALAPLPDHDFTAGSSSLTPVGGYADLARGPSPQPQMQETLMRGPSMTRPNYNPGVPLHHQAGYGTQDEYNYNGGAMRY